MNEGSQLQTNRTPINEEMEDEEMTEVAMPMAGMNPTRTSARLAEKLKKLMQSTDTNGNKDDMMEINEEEQRKHTHAIQLPVDLTKETPNSPSAAPSPGIKKSRNDKTPTPHANAKALFNTPSTSTQNQQMLNTTEKSATPMPKVTGTQQQAKALLESTAKSTKTAGQASTGTI